MTMFPSACAWAFRIPVTAALKLIKETAFHYVDVRPDTLDPPGAIEALNSLGLKVSCMELHDVGPELEKAKTVGAAVAYVRPSANVTQLRNFAARIAELADSAGEKGVKLCVEHVPGTALPSAAQALSFVRQINNPNLYLLLDVGHTLLSEEKPWEIVAAAGDRVGYVHMNDNDGRKDRHWPLLDGLLTKEDLQRTLEALNQAGYQGALGLQLSGTLRIPASDYARNRNLLLRLQLALGHSVKSV